MSSPPPRVEEDEESGTLMSTLTDEILMYMVLTPAALPPVPPMCPNPLGYNPCPPIPPLSLFLWCSLPALLRRVAAEIRGGCPSTYPIGTGVTPLEGGLRCPPLPVPPPLIGLELQRHCDCPGHAPRKGITASWPASKTSPDANPNAGL